MGIRNKQELILRKSIEKTGTETKSSNRAKKIEIEGEEKRREEKYTTTSPWNPRGDLRGGEIRRTRADNYSAGDVAGELEIRVERWKLECEIR